MYFWIALYAPFVFYLALEGRNYHIAALAGAFGVRKNEKVCAFQYFQYFNFKKLEKPEPFVRSEAQAFKKTHKWNNCRLECSVSLLFII